MHRTLALWTLSQPLKLDAPTRLLTNMNTIIAYMRPGVCQCQCGETTALHQNPVRVSLGPQWEGVTRTSWTKRYLLVMRELPVARPCEPYRTSAA